MRKGQACVFAGHRPASFPFQEDEDAPECKKIKLLLFKEIMKLAEKGVTDFYSGMAEGVDTWAAEMVLFLQTLYPAIRLECIVAYKEQSEDWDLDSRMRYCNILRHANYSTAMSAIYTKTCYNRRNQYFFSKAQILLAVFNGEKSSGTASTINYAY